jgi:PAS domain S-box-containing protein
MMEDSHIIWRRVPSEGPRYTPELTFEEAAAGFDHAVQFYGADESALIKNVGSFLAEGWTRGETLLVIATLQHRKEFAVNLRKFGVDTDIAMESGRLIMLDAERMLARGMAAILAEAIPSPRGATGIRVFTELTGLLWVRGDYTAAEELEAAWEQWARRMGTRVFCACPIDVLDPEFQTPQAEAILCAHSRMYASGIENALESAVEQAIADSIGSDLKSLPFAVAMDADSPGTLVPRAEATMLLLRDAFPQRAEEVATLARQYYRNEKKFRSLIENSFDAIIVVDESTKVLYASGSTLNVLGYRPVELVGTEAIHLVHPDDAHKAIAAIERALSEPRGVAQVELRVRLKDGRFSWVEGTLSNFMDEPDIRAIVANYRDIARRKSEEARAQKLIDKLICSEQEHRAFAHAVGHEVKDALGRARMLANVLNEGAQTPESASRFAHLVASGLRETSALIDDLIYCLTLHFDNETQPVDLSDSAASALRLLDRQIVDAGAEIHLSPLPVVAGNAEYLTLVFQHLIDNAVKFNDTAEPTPRVDIAAQRMGADWIIRVSDNGPGIPLDQQEHVFGMFKRLNGPEYPGTGIGLTVSRKIIEGLGGKIWLESGENGGTAVCFSVTALEQIVPENASASVPRRLSP